MDGSDTESPEKIMSPANNSKGHGQAEVCVADSTVEGDPDNKIFIEHGKILESLQNDETEPEELPSKLKQNSKFKNGVRVSHLEMVHRRLPKRIHFKQTARMSTSMPAGVRNTWTSKKNKEQRKFVGGYYAVMPDGSLRKY